MHKNLLKLFRQLIKLASVETPEAVLYYDGELEVGTEVFIEDENGELVPATNGEYGNIIVEDGKVSAIKEEVVIEEPVEEPVVDEEKEALKAKVAELEAIIAELEAKLAQIEEVKVEEEFNSLKPASKEIKDVVVSDKGALKYFQN